MNIDHCSEWNKVLFWEKYLLTVDSAICSLNLLVIDKFECGISNWSSVIDIIFEQILDCQWNNNNYIWFSCELSFLLFLPDQSMIIKS